ncbi:hypothetical protein OPX32_12435, partial [Staphylococcus epidermidis]|uniref:hypothetical protein n=1 Tax=Staphylococcus epidermidis TaxID=1282 RepID=UPI00223ECCEF
PGVAPLHLLLREGRRYLLAVADQLSLRQIAHLLHLLVPFFSADSFGVGRFCLAAHKTAPAASCTAE